MTRSLKDLLADRATLESKIATAKKAESAEALTTVLTLVNEFGFTAQQVFPWKPAKAKVAAKYFDEKTGAAWSGRGKPPRWIAGKNRDEFLVEKPIRHPDPFWDGVAAALARADS
ncbi:MAG: H-NS histone family protein [Hyphomicrobiales bacterium]|nr:MAG: H-NS histone family protein [Hyphomicrobiales bacterium]